MFRLADPPPPPHRNGIILSGRSMRFRPPFPHKKWERSEEIVLLARHLPSLVIIPNSNCIIEMICRFYSLLLVLPHLLLIVFFSSYGE